MNRTIKIDLNIIPPFYNLTDYKVLTPHKGAADELEVSHQSLKQVALQLLKSRGYEVATRAVAFETLSNVITDLFPESDDSSLAAGITLALQTIIRTGIDLHRLEQFGSARVKHLALIAREYQFRLRKKGLVDSEEVLWQASLLPIEPQKLFIYGYYRARTEEINLLAKLAGDGSIMYLPTSEHSIFKTNKIFIENLKQSGWVEEVEQAKLTTDFAHKITVGDKFAQRFIANSALHDIDYPPVNEYASVEKEVRGVLSRVKSSVLSGISPKDIVLVARDASIYGQTVLEIAWEYGIPIQLMYKVPLIETKFGAWIKLLLDCIEDNFSFDKTVRLLLHPVCNDMPDDLWLKIKTQQPRNLEAWSKLEVGLEEFKWKEIQSRKDWISQFLVSLQNLGIRKKVAVWARELIAFQKLQEELQGIKENLHVEISIQQFIREVHSVCSLIDVPFHPAAGGIEFHEPHTLIGAKYREVYVLGMAEGVLPGKVSDNPVVDFMNEVF